MAFADDLLEQAKHLARRERTRPRQASLRRALWTAYYSLFHLLISEATSNWKRAEQRPVLARFFEHGKMKAASEKLRGERRRLVSSKSALGPATVTSVQLLTVADMFVRAQDIRHIADYDNAKKWTRTEVLDHIDLVNNAFQSWRAVRKEPTAQSYLMALLGRPSGQS